jgi:hypothetical protein
MPISLERLRAPLQNFDFKALFTRGLNWKNVSSVNRYIEADGKTYMITPIAEQGDLMVAECVVNDTAGLLPPVTTRRKLSQEFAKYHHEHILIFTDRTRQNAVWLWPKRDESKLKPREQVYTRGQTGELLLGKLAGIAFTLDELDDAGRASIAEVSQRVARAFDVERVTRSFYEKFAKQHDNFQAFLKGIKDTTHQSWYTSVMLNRLMFLYFVQKKGFLDGNTDYLRTKLQASQAQGADRYYREFLIPLFFEGLACEPRERSDATSKLLGNVPYLNGGIFMPHQIEEANTGIELPDAAFESLFAFFDRYNWYLDDRPLRADNEINPDVLGYIFEKYINQKQMGAYYTKEDITDYICKYTILPFLLDKIDLNVAQELTSIDPLIYEAVKTPDTLPTETEREYAARQKRYEQIGLDFATGKIATVNDLITYNLDIRAFTSDWLRQTQAPGIVRDFYKALTELTVLDPTCGSGAFLFAAMNILEPLYEGCLRKMEQFVARPDGASFTGFQAELERVRQHPNERYFIFKSIIVNNLYGVDIMDEAVEICKLRLFLKLVAQVNDVRRIEPLPDIDFNIRAGNTLVGFATKAEIEGNMFARPALPTIEVMTGTLNTFRKEQLQTGVAPASLKELKKNIREKQRAIADLLDKALNNEYGNDDKRLPAFRASHKPFHWYAEYNSVMANGGFDVIVGNPPYVEYREVQDQYSVSGYQTEDCGNLFAFTVERGVQLIKSNFGRKGMIIPLSSISTDRMIPLIKLLKRSSKSLLVSNFSWRPGKLFDGVNLQLSIYLQQVGQTTANVYSSQYSLWPSEAREYVFPLLEYSKVEDTYLEGSIPKLGNVFAQTILQKIRKTQQQIGGCFTAKQINDNIVYYRRGGLYWKVFIDFPTGSSEEKKIKVLPEVDRYTIIAALSSSLWFWYFQATSDCRHLGNRDINTFPFDPRQMKSNLVKQLSELGAKYVEDLKNNAEKRLRVYNGKRQVQTETFFVKKSKPIIDEIDRVLAQHYGFTDEELDFIINYDIKYRMGRDADEGDEE